LEVVRINLQSSAFPASFEALSKVAPVKLNSATAFCANPVIMSLYFSRNYRTLGNSSSVNRMCVHQKQRQASGDVKKKESFGSEQRRTLGGGGGGSQ
jgi:hypothetical protein